jgi:hypothetical protein
MTYVHTIAAIRPTTSAPPNHDHIQIVLSTCTTQIFGMIAAITAAQSAKNIDQATTPRNCCMINRRRARFTCWRISSIASTPRSYIVEKPSKPPIR